VRSRLPFLCHPPWILLVFAAGSLWSCSSRQKRGPLSPQAALKSFRIDEGFEIELFASEPHVVDPVEVVFDASGQAFAAEMRDYPQDPEPGKPARSRIPLLRDANHDGRIDDSVVFADNVLQVTSMLTWKDGLLVASAPNILYFKDTDGDGRADIRKVMFTGFAMANSEARITNLRYGIDNWIYAANSGQPGEVSFVEKPDMPAVSVSGADFRFRWTAIGSKRSRATPSLELPWTIGETDSLRRTPFTSSMSSFPDAI